jgi:hypothetical protein
LFFCAVPQRYLAFCVLVGAFFTDSFAGFAALAE